jgi:serine/threonine-protein kinase HipA
VTILDVYLEAVPEPIGQLSSGPDGEMAFAYLTDALPHPISVSLPIQEEPFGDVLTRGFFSNLLFENEMRDDVMQRHGIAERDIVGLLYHLGSDCPGSISCVPKGQPPGKRPGDLAQDYMALSGAPVVLADLDDASGPLPVSGDLAQIMRSLRDHRRLPPDSDDPSPLAGVQGKIALARLPDGRLGLPKPGSGAPTTHILKVPRAAQMTSVLREHFATRLMAQAIGHPVARTCTLGEGDLQGLLVQRYDRRIEGTLVHRIHQEDFCQALGLGERLKYERNGVPPRVFSAETVGRLLDKTRLPGQARQSFFEITVANMLLGNSDNHGKNHALLYNGAKPDLAPAYDIEPVLLDDVRHAMAFRIGASTMADDVTAADLDVALRALGGRGFNANQARRCAAIATTLLEGAAQLPRPAGKGLCDVVRQQIFHLSANVGLGLEVPEFDNVPVNRE